MLDDVFVFSALTAPVLVQRHAIVQNLMTASKVPLFSFCLSVDVAMIYIKKKYKVILKSYRSSHVKSRVIGSQV